MASTIKVDNVQNQPGTNIVSKCGTDVTIGASGDTVALACGASQTGFGRTGTVDWVTTVQVTGDSPVTGVTGKGYFLNTTAGTITVNLPAGAAGSILAFKDYAGTWDSNNVTVTPNGSEKVGGIAGSTTLSTERQSVTLIYIDGTQGWLDIHDSTSAVEGPKYVTATGGTPCAGATSGDYKIHTFTGPGTLTVSCAGNAAGSNTVDYMVVAGGGGGGGEYGGGAGAGGYRESVPSPAAWTGSPIAFSGNARPVTATPYAITVGGGGTGASGGCAQGSDGNDSIFSDITSAGGGGGGTECEAGNAEQSGRDGGSGGGSAYYTPGPLDPRAGAGDVPNVTPDQGFPGGLAISPGTGGHSAGGGGGSGVVGGAAPAHNVAGAGGAGVTSCISATPTQRGGGGGGAGGGGPQPYTPGAGGAGGGGAGATDPSGAGTAGTVNTGGGGGGANLSGPSVGGTGGSGVVIIRYKFQ